MVIKFNPEGKVMMVLGRRPEASEGAVQTPQGDPPPDERYLFARPTDVGWDPQGNIFVSDGYINHRVVKFDKNGRFIRKVGSNLRGNRAVSVQHPAWLAVDAQGNVYVADRGNARIQVFDNNLTLRAIYDNVGNPWEVCISPGPHPVPVLVELEPRRQHAGRRGTPPARSTRWSSTAASSASSARQARRSASSRRCTASIAATRTSWSSGRSRRGACRRSACAADAATAGAD